MLILENGGFQGAWGGGRFVTTSDIRGTIFYDYNNTGYYCDPSSASYLYSLTLAGGAYFRPSTWIQFDSTYGLYWPNNYGAHLHANDLSTYTQLALRGSKNSYGGFYDQYSGVNGIMYDSGGNGGVYREANGRWIFYHNVGNNCMGVGTSSTSSTYGIYVTKGIYSDGRTDATIFYDANNTGYYLDPNSTTSLRTVGDWRADSSTWTGEFAGKIQYHSNNWYFQYTTEFIFRNASGSNVFYGDSSGNTFASASNRAPIFYDSNNTGYYADLNGTTYCYYLQSATSVRADSDRRIKDNIETITDALNKVKKLRGTTFTRKDLQDKNKKHIGLIAQEVLEVLPEVVGGSEETSYSVGYSEIVAVLIEAIKEQQKQIEELKVLIDGK